MPVSVAIHPPGLPPRHRRLPVPSGTHGQPANDEHSRGQALSEPNRRPPPSGHREQHKIGSLGGLRAAVLGADDGIVSTSSLVLGVAASSASGNAAVVAGIAGLVAGSLSKAAVRVGVGEQPA